MTPPRQGRTRTAALDTWRDFVGMLLVCLAVFSMILPAGEAAVIADDEAAETHFVRPDRAAFTLIIGVIRRVTLRDVVDDELEGGPDDDDFRPNPDRACALAHRAKLSPMPVRYPWAPASSSHASLLAPAWASDRHAAVNQRGCLALESSIQFLC